MLTAFGTPDNKIAGFDVGADDYIVKPFAFKELLARVNVFIRRSDSNVMISEKIGIADLVMDLSTKTVTRSNKKIDLTAKESLSAGDLPEKTKTNCSPVNLLLNRSGDRF